VVLAGTPLNLTELVPFVAPKFVPEMVTGVPGSPLFGDSPEIVGVGSTVNALLLLLTVPTRTTTLPVVAPAGTGTVILVLDQFVGVALVPLNVTVLPNCAGPKLVPLTVMLCPTPPEFGDKLEIFGAPSTVKLIALLVTPLTVTVTLPVAAPTGTGAVILVAVQELGIAVLLLKNLSALVP
jgi:hypothetical protein